MKTKILVLVLILLSIHTLAFADAENKILNKRIINHTQKTWNLSAIVNTSVEEANKHITIIDDKGNTVPIDITKSKDGNILLRHTENYEKGKTYKIVIDGKIKLEPTSKKLEHDIIIPFEYIDYDLVLESGITQFQRLVKVDIIDNDPTLYEVIYKEEVLNFREKDNLHIGFIDEIDEEEILKGIIVQEKTVKEGDYNDKNSQK